MQLPNKNMQAPSQRPIQSHSQVTEELLASDVVAKGNTPTIYIKSQNATFILNQPDHFGAFDSPAKCNEHVWPSYN